MSAAFYVFSDFMHYDGGVYARTAGSSLIGGHVVKIIGWGNDVEGGDYWVVANSWGQGQDASHPGWGEDGYFRIVRGTEECAFEQRVEALLVG